MTNNSQFFNNLATNIDEADMASRGGLTYLFAGAAMARAGRPNVKFVDFGDLPYLPMLGGSVVAVDLEIPGGATQRIYLPVMDKDWKSLQLGKTSSVDINNNRQRALVKAIACVYGVGMSLYMKYKGDGEKVAKLLNITPETDDLSAVPPMVALLKEGGSPYIEWSTAIAAVRIVDPTFHWSVKTWGEQQLPYREVLGGAIVDVETTFKGKSLTLSLPLYDAKHNQLPLKSATVWDWNTAVQRALTKCIAFNSGYGLSVYSGDELGVTVKPLSASPAPNPEEVQQAAITEALAPEAPKAPEVVEASSTQVEAPAAPVAQVAEVAPEAPIAQEAAPEASVSHEPAPAHAEPSTAQAEPDDEVAERFKGVLRRRLAEQGINGVVSLYDAISASTKFTAEEKPTCYKVLTRALASLSKSHPDLDVGAMLTKMAAHNAMSYVPVADVREKVAARFVRAAIDAGVASSDSTLLDTMLAKVVAAKVATDEAQLIYLAERAGTPAEAIDLVRLVLEDNAG